LFQPDNDLRTNFEMKEMLRESAFICDGHRRETAAKAGKRQLGGSKKKNLESAT